MPFQTGVDIETKKKIRELSAYVYRAYRALYPRPVSVESILKEAGADLVKADLDKIAQKFREQGILNNGNDNIREDLQTMKDMTDADFEKLE